jgi:hypothetical protein
VDRPESERGATASSVVADDSSNDGATDDASLPEAATQQPADEVSTEAEEEASGGKKIQASASDAIARTRKELAELDDLDI